MVVPAQEKPWIIHDCGSAKLAKYDRNRRIFTENYSEYLTYDGGMSFEYNGEWDELSSQLVDIVKTYIDAGEWWKVEQALQFYKRNNYKNSELEKQCIINDIYKAEMKKKSVSIFCKEGMKYAQIEKKYIRVRFAMRRYELGIVDNVTANYEKNIIREKISIASILVMLPHTTIRTQDFIMRLLLCKDDIPKHCRETFLEIANYAVDTKKYIAYGRKY